MSGIMEKAHELGGAMARTDEYQALKRAIDASSDDRDVTELRNELDRLEAAITVALRAGKEPEDDDKTAYEQTLSRLQANSTYQRLVAAQTNFDKVVQRVNEQISKGLEEGASSRIILT